LIQREWTDLKYEEIDEQASGLGRHLTVFQMEVGHGVPALVLAAQVKIIARVATKLAEMLDSHPDAEVTIDPRLNEGMETAWRDILAPGTDVPDSPEGLE
jgi:hypothetical protein